MYDVCLLLDSCVLIGRRLGMPTTLTAAVPHCVTRDDVYKGYQIPRRATIMMNVCFPSSTMDI